MRINTSNTFVGLFTLESVSWLSTIMCTNYWWHCVCDKMSAGIYTCNANKKCAKYKYGKYV